MVEPHPGNDLVNARTEILRRLATALADDRRPAGVTRAYRVTGTLDGPALVALFTDRLLDYRAEVLPCRGEDLDAVVTARLAERDVPDLVLPPVPPVDLTAWTGRRHQDAPGAPLTTTDLDAARGVLTGCAVAVAETGTIVLDAGPDQGRRALTLIPDYHLVVVRAEQIVQTVPEALARLDPTRPLTWISGPSATSDIELDRVEGVHGPRTLDVVLVGPDPDLPASHRPGIERP